MTCRYCGGAKRFQIVSSVSDHAWADCFCSRPAEPALTGQFDVYKSLPGFNKRECLGTFLNGADLARIMTADAALQLADETQRYGGRHGPYASWHVTWSAGDSGKGYRGELE